MGPKSCCRLEEAIKAATNRLIGWLLTHVVVRWRESSAHRRAFTLLPFSCHPSPAACSLSSSFWLETAPSVFPPDGCSASEALHFAASNSLRHLVFALWIGLEFVAMKNLRFASECLECRSLTRIFYYAAHYASKGHINVHFQAI